MRRVLLSRTSRPSPCCRPAWCLVQITHAAPVVLASATPTPWRSRRQPNTCKLCPHLGSKKAGTTSTPCALCLRHAPSPGRQPLLRPHTPGAAAPASTCTVQPPDSPLLPHTPGPPRRPALHPVAPRAQRCGTCCIHVHRAAPRLAPIAVILLLLRKSSFLPAALWLRRTAPPLSPSLHPAPSSTHSSAPLTCRPHGARPGPRPYLRLAPAPGPRLLNPPSARSLAHSWHSLCLASSASVLYTRRVDSGIEMDS